MADTSGSTEPVQLTYQSLVGIRNHLSPFLKILNEEYNKSNIDVLPESYDDNNNTQQRYTPKHDPHVIAEAEIAVALTLATIQHVSARLSGKKPDKGLKMELDKMKKILVRLMKKKKQLKLHRS